MACIHEEIIEEILNAGFMELEDINKIADGLPNGKCTGKFKKKKW